MPAPICPVCSNPVSRNGFHGPWPTYCSRKCASRVDYLRRKAAGTIPKPPSVRRERDCAVCGKSMGVVSKNRKTCGPRCQEISTGKICSIPDCGRPVRARGLCVTDYIRWRRETVGPEVYVHTPAQVDKKHARRAAMYGAQKGDPVNHLAIFERDDWQCQLCRAPVDRELDYPEPFSASLDHIVRLVDGGLHDPGNVQLAHLVCNIRKG